MLTCWYINHEPDPLKPDWYSAMLIGLVIGGMFLGSLLTLLYYRSGSYIVWLSYIAILCV